eukprot:Platyproteum_vivax@DN8302_c0_g1_i1.p1
MKRERAKSLGANDGGGGGGGKRQQQHLSSSDGKPRFFDHVIQQGRREYWAEFQSMDAHQRHMLMTSWIGKSSAASGGDDGIHHIPSWAAGQAVVQNKPNPDTIPSDWDILKKYHQFLRDEKEQDDSWETKLSWKYYNKLYKEYVCCDLSRYKKGQVGFRWRTEAEVVRGKGQFTCGNLKCDIRNDLRSYEINFKYKENGLVKQALVKARVCLQCAYKLNYRHIQAAKKKRRKLAKKGLLE